MTPKEKAKELVDKFTFRCEECDYDWNAKQCALIAVDEILQELENADDGQTSIPYEYWEQVKSEIQKL
tara:strand:- start:50 stop:253 length:204 start_codon:yes stop_codon:yes gene_type:complete